jgi:hypothetical protein
MAFNHAAAQAARNGTHTPVRTQGTQEQPQESSHASPAAQGLPALAQTSNAITALSVGSVCELVDKFVDTLAQRHLATFPGLVAITGRIDSIPSATKYSWHYDVVISGGSSTFYIELPKSEVEAKGITKGAHVRVIGRIVLKTWQGSIKPRLVAAQVDSIEAPDMAASRASQMATLERLHQLRKTRYGFPIKDKLRVAVVCGRSSQVLDDFLGSLKEVASSVQVETDQVSITSEEDVAQAIANARGDILAVIRGGGPESEFAVFDSERVLSALAAAPCYRIVALGHTQHQTMADLIADYSADTPTAAGQFVREQMRALLARLQIQRKAIETEVARAQAEARSNEARPQIEEKRPARTPSANKGPSRVVGWPVVVGGVITVWILISFVKWRLAHG